MHIRLCLCCRGGRGGGGLGGVDDVIHNQQHQKGQDQLVKIVLALLNRDIMKRPNITTVKQYLMDAMADDHNNK